ncbi:MAG: CGNR zinc finger domain-containing protein [Nitrospirota bacterium]
MSKYLNQLKSSPPEYPDWRKIELGYRTSHFLPFLYWRLELCLRSYGYKIVKLCSKCGNFFFDATFNLSGKYCSVKCKNRVASSAHYYRSKSSKLSLTYEQLLPRLLKAKEHGLINDDDKYIDLSRISGLL